MKKHFIFFALFFALIINSNAQGLFKDTYLYFTPTTLVSYYPLLRFGIEKQYNQTEAILFEGGFGANANHDNPYSRYQVRGTFKYFLSKPENNNKTYLFFDLFFNNVTIHHNTKFSYGDGISTHTFDKCIQQINKPGINLGFGCFIYLTDRFKLDFCIGAGVVKRSISYSDKVNEVIKHNTSNDYSLFGRINNEETKTTFSSKAGISLVYKLVK